MAALSRSVLLIMLAILVVLQLLMQIVLFSRSLPMAGAGSESTVMHQPREQLQEQHGTEERNRIDEQAMAQLQETALALSALQEEIARLSIGQEKIPPALGGHRTLLKFLQQEDEKKNAALEGLAAKTLQLETQLRSIEAQLKTMQWNGEDGEDASSLAVRGAPQNACEWDDADSHPLADAGDIPLADLLKVVEDSGIVRQEAMVQSVPRDDDIALESTLDVFSGSPSSLLFRLAFPSGASSLLRDNIERLAGVPPSERIHNCTRPVLVGCGSIDTSVAGIQSTGALSGLSLFRAFAGNIAALPNDAGGQHTVLERKQQTAQSLADAHPNKYRSSPILRATMLREPSQYAKRIWRGVDGMDRAHPAMRPPGAISDRWVRFDRTFEGATNCSLDVATMPQWVSLAHWRWNYFTRGLAGEYPHKLLLDSERDAFTEREHAWSMNEHGVGARQLLDAVAALHSFHFFGIFDRIPESMELFAFTFCSDVGHIEHEFSTRIMRSREELSDRGDRTARGMAAVGEATDRVMRQRNRLDFVLFQYAEHVFDQRLEEMRTARAAGYRCKLTHSPCGLACR
eukprot:TRINITY_DN3158_c0_g1_i1.p1 TRINITY_DN3158_c0_g1~~TRINITY_DN3158_c0_g1_i1.p1  ORF type:complete len:572 (-),score=113.02 TRINITY_DN3158_c0_g1_i1:504-2219(-)